MRRTALTIAGLATAGLCTLALTQSAQAAEGLLVVNGVPHHNPSGCIEGRAPRLDIRNHTNQYAFVFTAPGCHGHPDSAVPPGASGIKPGLSVLIS